MGVRLKSLFSLLCLTASSAIFTSAAMAQPQDPVGSRQVRFETIPEAVDRVLTRTSGTFLESTITVEGQLDVIFGLGSLIEGTFPENELVADNELLVLLYRDVLNQQVSTTPIIRTPDLNSPFNSSLLTGPGANSRVVGSELVYERPILR